MASGGLAPREVSDSRVLGWLGDDVTGELGNELAFIPDLRDLMSFTFMQGSFQLRRDPQGVVTIETHS